MKKPLCSKNVPHTLNAMERMTRLHQDIFFSCRCYFNQISVVGMLSNLLVHTLSTTTDAENILCEGGLVQVQLQCPSQAKGGCDVFQEYQSQALHTGNALLLSIASSIYICLDSHLSLHLWPLWSHGVICSARILFTGLAIVCFIISILGSMTDSDDAFCRDLLVS